LRSNRACAEIDRRAIRNLRARQVSERMAVRLIFVASLSSVRGSSAAPTLLPQSSPRLGSRRSSLAAPKAPGSESTWVVVAVGYCRVAPEGARFPPAVGATLHHWYPTHVVIPDTWPPARCRSVAARGSAPGFVEHHHPVAQSQAIVLPPRPGPGPLTGQSLFFS